MKNKKICIEKNNFFIKNRKAAMEMSVGTIVTIVLLMAVLVLGLTLVNRIFDIGGGAVDLTDQQLKQEISNIFGDDTTKRIAVYPATKITLKKGQEVSPLGFSVRNNLEYTTSFPYSLSHQGDTCGGLDADKANDLIALRRTGEEQVTAGSVMNNPKLFEFVIPEDFPPCVIDYKLNVNYMKRQSNGQFTEEFYDSIDITVQLKGR